MNDLAKLIEPDGKQIFALMDDAAIRMSENLALIGDRFLSDTEHASLVKTFREHNATLERQIRDMDAQIESFDTQMGQTLTEASAKLDATHAAYVERQQQGWAKYNSLTRGLTWFTWTMFWISGYFAHGALNRLTGWTW